MKRLNVYARVMALLWAIGWMCVFVYQANKWRAAVPATTAWIALGLAFLMLAILPRWRRWELAGGALLIICGAALGVAYAIWPVDYWKSWYNLLIHAALSAPPTLAGFLFVIHRLSTARAERELDRVPMP